MSTTAELVIKLNKEYNGMVKSGAEGFSQVMRIPTGIFSFDLATGGGFPMGRNSIVYGPESSNKTNTALKALGQAQKILPKKKAVLIDTEGTYDKAWARKLGVDVESLIVAQPDYAEQAVDLTEAFLYADDVSFVLLDSIAGLVTQNEIESSAEKVAVGGASLCIGKMFKKSVVSFNRMRNSGLEPPAFVSINQIRLKIGVMFGDPETMPGGNAPKFASSLTVRTYGKNELDKKINPVMPAFKRVSFVVKKWKVPILSTNGEYNMQMLKGNGREVGHVEDWNTLANYLKELDYLTKSKTGWLFNGAEYKTQEEIRTLLYSDPLMLNEVKQALIAEMMEKGSSLGEEGGEEADE